MHHVWLHRDSENAVAQLQLADNGSIDIINVNGWHSVPQILSHLTSIEIT